MFLIRSSTKFAQTVPLHWTWPPELKPEKNLLTSNPEALVQIQNLYHNVSYKAVFQNLHFHVH